MSGWYVELLLLNREGIRQSIYNSEYSELAGSDISSINLDDSTYNDLLDIERAISNLVKNNSLSQLEIDVINTYINTRSLTKSAKELNMSRITFTKIFKNACFKISYFLGGHFTDDGYVEYLTEKYNLSEKEIEKIYKYIEGNYRLREVNLTQ